MGCGYYYGVDICDVPAEEDNYETFLRLPSTREAIHTGNLPFGSQSGDVYQSMLDVFMKSERETVEFLLERYPVSLIIGTTFLKSYIFNFSILITIRYSSIMAILISFAIILEF